MAAMISVKVLSRRWWLCAPLVCAVLLMGCENPQKAEPTSEADVSQRPAAQETSPAEPAATKSDAPRPAAQPAVADAASEQKTLDEMTPEQLIEHIRKLAAEQGVTDESARATDTGGSNEPPRRFSTLAKADVSSRRRSDEPRAMTEGADTPQDDRGAAVQSEPKPFQVPGAKPVEAPATPDTAQKDDGGCASKSATAPNAIKPPPPDAPQPRYVVKEPTITRDDVWSGDRPTFEFAIANDGEGPLEIRVKGG